MISQDPSIRKTYLDCATTDYPVDLDQIRSFLNERFYTRVACRGERIMLEISMDAPAIPPPITATVFFILVVGLSLVVGQVV